MKTISRYIMTLALLITAVGGAWAQTQWTSGECTVTLNNGTLTVSGNGAMADYDNLSERPWHDNMGDITSVVVESGVTSVGMAAFYFCTAITSVTLPEGLTAIGGSAFDGCSSLTSITIPSTVTSIGGGAFKSCSAISDVNLYANPDNLTWSIDTHFASDDFKSDKATKCHVLAEHLSTYQNNFSIANVTFVGDLQPLPTPIEVKWDAATKTGTFEMPAFDVEIAPIYAPVAQWAKVEDVDQLPTAAEGIYAESTDSIITPGKVAKIGETDNVQGTLMYAIGTSATEAPAPTAFSATLPTAKDITTAGDVYVWYYIKGADTPEGQEASAENTFNDSEICTTPLKVTVLNNKFNLTLSPAPVEKVSVTIDGTAATPDQEGKIEAVKLGKEVKMTAKEGYKFRKVEAKKTSTPN